MHAQGYSDPSKKVQKFKAFSSKSVTKVKSVIAPHGGQSVNPTLQAHQQVLKAVVKEEEKQIEQDYQGSYQHAMHQTKAAMDSLKQMQQSRAAKQKAEPEESASEKDDSESSGSESSDEEESGNKPVDRLKKLTKNQRNQKKLRKERNLKQISDAKDRRQQKQYDKIPAYINEDIRENKESKARIAKRLADEALEKKVQETEGVVNKASKVGRRTY